MADNPVPIWRDIARSAGEDVRQKLGKGLDPRHQTRAQLIFDIVDFDAKPSDDLSNDPGRLNDLIRAMKHFESHLLKERHPNGEIEWRRVFVIIKDVKEVASNDASGIASYQTEDVWFLAIASGKGDEDKIGRSFSLHTKFPVVEGDYFVAYKIHRAK